VFEITRRVLRQTNLTTLSIAGELGWAYFEQGRLEDPAKVREEVLEKATRRHELDYPGTLVLMHDLAKNVQRTKTVQVGSINGRRGIVEAKTNLGCPSSAHSVNHRRTCNYLLASEEVA